ncbi:MAG: PEP-CTERM sorting domain-containing protein [Thiobacillaceae bacterium]
MRYLPTIMLSLLPVSAWAQVGTIPEPETLFLFGLGAAILLAVRKRK